MAIDDKINIVISEVYSKEGKKLQVIIDEPEKISKIEFFTNPDAIKDFVSRNYMGAEITYGAISNENYQELSKDRWWYNNEY